MTARTTFGRVAAVFAAVALVATSALSANAQTMTEAELRAEIARLSALLNPSTTTNAAVAGTLSCPVDPATITSAGLLKQGMSSANVKNLQVLLNYFASAKGLNTRVAVSGAGSAGMETSYFGPATRAAVANFQAAYRAEILTPLGLTAPTGIWAGATNAQAVLLCTKVTVPTTPTTPTDPDDEDEDEDSDELEGGEATIDDFDLRSADDAEEGMESTVATIEFGAKDGDLQVERLDLEFMNASSTDGDRSPWNVFDTVALEVDGDEVASMDVDSRSDWSRQSNGYYRLRFTDLEDLIVREDDDVQIDIVVTPSSVVRDAPVTWTVRVSDDGMRTVDSEGLNDYAGEDSDVVTFDIDEEGDNSEIKARKSSDNPSATTLEVMTDGRSDEYSVLGFELSAEDAMAIVNGLDFDLEFSNGENYSDVVDRATLMLDGRSYNVDSTTGSTTASTTLRLSFDVDGDVELEDGDDVEGELMLRFRSTATYNSGTTVRARLVRVDAETENGADLSETVNVAGETHTLVSEGLSLTKGTSSATASASTNNGAKDRAVFQMSFDVTAVNEDFYIPSTAVYASSTARTGGAEYEVYNADGTLQPSTGGPTGALSSTAERVNGYFFVGEGETERFTLNVTYDPTTAGYYYLQLVELNFNDDEQAPDSTIQALPRSDFRTTNTSEQVQA